MFLKTHQYVIGNMCKRLVMTTVSPLKRNVFCNIIDACHHNVENTLRFKCETVVPGSRLHIFPMKYYCFFRKRIGALGESTIVNSKKNNLHIFQMKYWCPWTTPNGYFSEMYLFLKENICFCTVHAPCFSQLNHFD